MNVYVYIFRRKRFKKLGFFIQKNPKTDLAAIEGGWEVELCIKDIYQILAYLSGAKLSILF
jgi:hypothetical protein